MNTLLLLLSLTGPVNIQLDWRETPRKGGDPISTQTESAVVSSGAVPLTETAPEPLTTVCRCQGYKEQLCLCLKAGQKCHCTRTSGSVWAVNEQGRATHKTGAKADPRGTQPFARRDAPAASVSDNTVPRQKSDGKWWWQGPDGTWFGTATLTDGQTYVSGTNQFVYRDGKMAPKMAVQIPTGRWVKRCYGSYCRMEWVPN